MDLSWKRLRFKCPFRQGMFKNFFVVCEIVGFVFRDGCHICFPTPWLTHSTDPLKVENRMGTENSKIPFLLPHEIFDSLASAGKFQVGNSNFGCSFVWYMSTIMHATQSNRSRRQFSLSMTGGRSGPDIAAFWDHVFSQDEWSSHPARFLSYIKRDRNFVAV